MERTVRELVTLRGGRLFHVRRSDVAPELKDLLDWLIIDPAGGRVLMVEGKSSKRIITPGQRAVLDLAGECSRFEALLVRAGEPHDETEIGFDQFISWLGGNHDR